MAKTRAQIKAMVKLLTGRSDKDTLIETLCDDALKTAVMRHNFRDAHKESVFNITTNYVYVDISSANLLNISTCRIIDSVTEDSAPLILKSKIWFDKTFTNPDDNMQAWPTYACRFGGNLLFNCPVEANKALYTRASYIPTFTNDSTVCPISLIDLFIEKFVTAKVFLGTEETLDKYKAWMIEANDELNAAIEADKDVATELKFEGVDNSLVPDFRRITTNENGTIRSWT
jgi:hypothetical protein